ncbi:unnamed protein product [Onchocerca ochengi]|uniref:Transmembrane protein n=1 Tax=Onchocerca ochengi TaxID=42157 RepID=A0A182ETH9_ONCOC|nr:unnamed protein product [Onchocerca ochengi]
MHELYDITVVVMFDAIVIAYGALYGIEMTYNTIGPATRGTIPITLYLRNVLFSKSSEEDSAYAGFGSSSPISSAESSSMSINSTSSRNSSGSGTTNPRIRTLTTLTFHQSTANHRFIGGGTIQPPSSPHEMK